MITYKDMFNLSGKTALVTGALGILGRNFCRGLAEAGANVVIVDLEEAKAEEFAIELSEQYEVQAIGVGCDVSQSDQVSRMVQRTVSMFGEINILHNNAASKSSDLERFLAPLEDYTIETWREVMSVNLDGFFLVAKEVGKQMRKQGKGGSIIQTASIYGAMGPDHRIYEGSFYMGKPISSPAVYSASKGGVIALTKYLATYWADIGIRVNSLTPGGVESGQNEEFSRRYSARIPLGRMASEHDMVGALLYLASDASTYVTGQNIMVDGGLSAW
ncbi:short-chain dehydrogenase [Paenibacillus riograndensis]|nr:short-chain dehydrogenase [Paenibacillus riograndensis]